MSLFEKVKNLRRSGNLPEARDLLLQAASWDDPHLVTQTVLVLNNLEDSACLQQALSLAISALPTVKRAYDEYLLFLHRRAEQHVLGQVAMAPLLGMIEARMAKGEVPAGSPLALAWAGGQARRTYGAGFQARAAQMGFEPNFIPLGLNCMPWVLTNR